MTLLWQDIYAKFDANEFIHSKIIGMQAWVHMHTKKHTHENQETKS